MEKLKIKIGLLVLSIIASGVFGLVGTSLANEPAPPPCWNVVLTSLSITTPATKLAYTVGDALDIAGLVVTGNYCDATSKVETITPANITGFSSAIPTTSQTLTIAIGAISTSYVISVNAVPVTHIISGTIKYYDGVKVVPNANVILNDGTGTQVASTSTDVNGFYQFTGLTDGGNYVVSVNKIDNTTTGITAADQLSIGRHIVGIQLINLIYGIIAGDVNNSGGLTAADQLGIGRFIVGLSTSLVSGSWKFYPTNSIPTISNYLTISQTMNYINLTADAINQNFTGVKMGDTNNTWI